MPLVFSIHILNGFSTACICDVVTIHVMPQARDGNSVCVALSGQDGKYVIINIQEGNVWRPSPIHIPCNKTLSVLLQQMFDILNYEPGTTPFVRRMGKVSVYMCSRWNILEPQEDY